jgi:hypothetical protein
MTKVPQLLKHYRGAPEAVNAVPMDEMDPRRRVETTCSS